MEALLQIRPYNAATDQKELVENAHADGHAVYFPSYVLVKNNEIVGYLSMAVPVVLSWQDSKKMNALDSVKEIGFIEGALAQHPFVCIPCDPESPYMRFLPKAGYVPYTKPVNLFIKAR